MQLESVRSASRVDSVFDQLRSQILVGRDPGRSRSPNERELAARARA